MESQAMDGGGGAGFCGDTSTCNSYRTGGTIVKDMIEETIAKKLDVKALISSSSNTFRLADVGCSTGPNTFYCVQNILEAVKRKFQSQSSDAECEKLMLQVFFNDLATNDFNTLFLSLPPRRQYFAAGVPGSFHGQLFPDSSIHLVHSTYALHWLSRVPPQLLDKGSDAWNKGRVFYTSAPDEVVKAYTDQFAKDMGMFLDARAKEVVEGGMMALILPSVPDGMPHSSMPMNKLFDHLGTCLLDMAEEGIIDEALLDSFNIPLYIVSPVEMIEIVERNGCFKIERMESTKPLCLLDFQPNGRMITMNLRAGMAGVISQHFGEDIMDELFDRFMDKIEEIIDSLASTNAEGTQLTVFLERKAEPQELKRQQPSQNN